MDWSIYDVAEWLQQNIDRTVSVMKNEQEDIDEVSIRLRDVGVSSFATPDYDDYVEQQTLVLYGEGSIGENGKASSLPYGEFEIPVSGAWVCLPQSENELAIQTDRARYTIRLH